MRVCLKNRGSYQGQSQFVRQAKKASAVVGGAPSTGWRERLKNVNSGLAHGLICIIFGGALSAGAS